MMTAIKDALEKAFPGIGLRPVRDSLLLENTVDLPRVAEFLKNSPDFRLDYLSNITAVDYLQYLESVYHFYSMEKKTGLVTLRVRVQRDAPQVPSLVGIYRGAEFQERYAFDLYGIEYTGHPDLRRIVMWEGFEGFPMRKDYVQENTEVLDDEDIRWLEAHQVAVPEKLRRQAAEAKNPPAADSKTE